MITPELLKSWNPCTDGYKRFIQLFPQGATLDAAIAGLVQDGHDDWGLWLFNECQNRSLFPEITCSGYWNSGNGNSGYFNIDAPNIIRVFGKDCQFERWREAYKPQFLYFTPTEWVRSCDMTEQEKLDHGEHATAGGFLRTTLYKDAFRRSWELADRADRIRVKDLPNFDADIFFEISGIDLREGGKDDV